MYGVKLGTGFWKQCANGSLSFYSIQFNSIQEGENTSLSFYSIQEGKCEPG